MRKNKNIAAAAGLLLLLGACSSDSTDLASPPDSSLPSTAAEVEQDPSNPVEAEQEDVVDTSSNNDGGDSDEGISAEEAEADDLAMLMSSDVSLAGAAPESVVVGEPFDVELVASVVRINSSVDVEFELPDGVSLVGGDCGVGTGVVECGLDVAVGAVEPLEVSVQLVVDADGPLASGGSFEVEARAGDQAFMITLAEAPEDIEYFEFTPENNIITFSIEATVA